MTACCVTGCKRASRKEWNEWICSRHWQAVPKRQRRFYALIKRRYDRAPSERLADMGWSAWERCKRIAERRDLDPMGLIL